MALDALSATETQERSRLAPSDGADCSRQFRSDQNLGNEARKRLGQAIAASEF